ncbi:MAG: response regulator [Phormidium sp.]
MNQALNSPQINSILIVDDTPENLNLLSGMLSGAGYKVHLAPSGKIALKFIETNKPDLILLDIMMPQIDGYEICKQLKSSPVTQDIPVIFLSALQEVFDKVKAFSLGAVDYITKPFECQEVLARIENQLRLRRLSKQLSEQNDRLSQEIQQRKQIEEELRRSEEQRRLTLDLTHIGTWQWHVATDKADWNDNMYRLLGLVPGEVESSRLAWRSRLHPEDLERVHQAVIHALTTHTDHEVEYRVVYPDGNVHWLLSRGRGIYNEAGEPVRMTGVVLDIGLRKIAEETLKEQKELLQTIFDHVPVMIALFDSPKNDGTLSLLWINQAWEKILGWNIEELISKEKEAFVEFYPNPVCRQIFLDQMLRANSEWRDFQIKIRDGSMLDTSWAFIRLSNGQIIAIGQDIRERKQAEEASILEERNRMAREIHDSLAQAFTGIIIQLGAASRVMGGVSEDAIAHINTVRDLARYGLTEARRSVAALRPQLLEEGDLGCALSRLATQMSSNTNTQILFEVIGAAYSLPPEVEHNLLRIGQEALTNAFKYAYASEIKIELVYETEHFLLLVRDNGQGFDSASVTGGFGLLGMTERASRMGAQLTIQSQPRQGTSVEVSFIRGQPT